MARVERVDWVNSARGIAALLVLVSHFAQGFWLKPGATALSRNNEYIDSARTVPEFALAADLFPLSLAGSGVGLFFLISGFVITLSLETSSRLKFAVSRSLRIFPTYAAGYAVTILTIMAMGDPASELSPREVLVGSVPGLGAVFNTSVPADGIVWTLIVELVFYFLCLIPFKRLTHSIRAAVFLSLSCVLGNTFLVNLYPLLSQQIWVPYLLIALADIPYMLIGAIWALVWRGRLDRSRGWFFSSIFMGVHAILVMMSPVMSFDWKYETSFLAMMVAFGLLSSGRRVTSKRIRMRWLSDISYPLYVVHPVLGYATMSVLMMKFNNPVLAIIVATSVSMFLAFALHVIVEKPSQGVSKKLTLLIESRT